VDENKCPYCGETLVISNSGFEVVNDDSPDTPTELYSVLQLVCINSRRDPVSNEVLCINYCGSDLSKPKTIVKTVKNLLPLGI
jgi:hypothetical protein